LIEAALREITEETGIMHIKSIFDLKYTFIYKETKKGVLMDMQGFCFAAECKCQYKNVRKVENNYVQKVS